MWPTRRKQDANSNSARQGLPDAGSANAAALARISKAVAKRPHLGSEQLKYQYEVHVQSATFLPGVHVPLSALSILWTRGTKTAITRECTIPTGERAAHFDQHLTLICTLFREQPVRPAGPQFSEKLCTFKVLQHSKRRYRVNPLTSVETSILVCHVAKWPGYYVA